MHAIIAKHYEELRTENAILSNKLEMAEACIAGDNALIEGLKKDILAQQAVIEQKNEALKVITRRANCLDVLEIARTANEALALQPSLTALREHDVEALTTFFEHFAEGKYLEIEADEFQRYIERIRKGE